MIDWGDLAQWDGNMGEPFTSFTDPDKEKIGDNVAEFLNYLGGPAHILLTGECSSRTRAYITLIHGNEPSGLLALFRWLKSGYKPRVNILCIVASVPAANTVPLFNNRFLEPDRDLNRCFSGPYTDTQGRLAKAILDTLKKHQPEAAIDLHNTSGSGPAFAVSVTHDQQHEMLAAMFTHRLIITHLKLGALMEISEYLCPTVTIECGGRLDDESHEIAWDGLKLFFTADCVFVDRQARVGLELLHNPVRVELNDCCELCYGEKAATNQHLTLLTSIEHLNSGITVKNTLLGWINTEKINALNQLFTSKNSRDDCVLEEMFYLDGNQLLTRQELKLFMITTNAQIAKSDCLFYAVKSDGSEIGLLSSGCTRPGLKLES